MKSANGRADADHPNRRGDHNSRAITRAEAALYRLIRVATQPDFAGHVTLTLHAKGGMLALPKTEICQFENPETA